MRLEVTWDGIEDAILGIAYEVTGVLKKHYDDKVYRTMITNMILET